MITGTRRFNFLKIIGLGLLITVLVNPVTAAMALEAYRPVSLQKTVSASAEIVPAHVAPLGFLISGIAREVPVTEGTL